MKQLVFQTFLVVILATIFVGKLTDDYGAGFFLGMLVIHALFLQSDIKELRE